jgi:DoxX-like family
MVERLGHWALPGLRWAVGLVVVWESCAFVCGSAARAFAHTGLPHWMRPALGSAEALAAVLFLVPGTTLAGGYALLGIFVLAAAIHVLHGWYDVGGLVVYFAAVLVCVVEREGKLPGGRS